MNFTREQEQAIRVRDRDILVSAGAGAGKTRVLVSRMAEMILDEEQPLSVDAFLVMTFTNAAAEEMRERITSELHTRLSREPENRRLRKQIRMMKHADISTVHSFCNRLIRTHFNEAGIDPSFRIGEEGELFLLRQKAMEEVLEEAYTEGRESFLRFVEAYAPGKNDRMIETLIEEFYQFSRGFPDREQWLAAVMREQDLLESAQTIGESRALRSIVGKAKRELSALAGQIAEGEQFFGGDTEPERFFMLLERDRETVERLLSAEGFDALCDVFSRLTCPDLPRANKKEKEWPHLEAIKAIHKTVRETLYKLRDDFFLWDTEELCAQNRALRPFLQELATLAVRYEELYFQSKKENNVFDFDDLEHIALSLLIESYDEEGRPVPSGVAEELSRKYKAIFVDEYQDTNLVQEAIITAVCREGRNHLFVVGDVKQSIYRFRQARPDLFLSRYERYRRQEEEEDTQKKQGEEAEKSAGEEEGVRIELRDNFRSVPGVLHFCNLVFESLMDRQFGGVDYTGEIALRPGQGGPMEKEEEQSEMLLLVEDEEKAQLAVEVNTVEAETALIARRIRELLEEGYTYDEMVILLRSGAGRAEFMAEWLNHAGIPAVCESHTGYFQTREVQLVLNYLAIVDNVYQDIPMASVLLSSIGGLTEEELASLRVLTSIPTRQEYAFYDLIEIYLEEGEDAELRKKLARFQELLLYFRRKKKELPLHTLLWEIYEKTGIFYQVQMLPEGEARKENLLMLLKKAEDYEKTVFKGLFYFLRYMEQLRTYEVEIGSASPREEGSGMVRIMTIHKSKGLEFPVVFVSGLSRQFNLMDGNGPVLFHPEMGVGMEYVDLSARTHHASLLKKAIREQMRKETLEEELRILYVAMTRAQRKLILTGTAKAEKIEKAQPAGGTPERPERSSEKITPERPERLSEKITPEQSVTEPGKGDTLSLEKRLAARSFMDWLLPLLPKLPVKKVHFHELEGEFGGTEEKKRPLSLEEYMQKEEMQVDISPVKKAFSFVYPHREAAGWKRKYAVSELKKLSMMPLAGEEEEALPEGEGLLIPGGLSGGTAGTAAAAEAVLPEVEVPKPRFLSEEEPEVVGAARGTIIHKILELLPFGEVCTKKELFEALARIEKQYPDCARISMKAVYRGLEQLLFSEIGEKLRQMDQAGALRKELPFTVGLPSSLFHKEDRDSAQEEEMIVVQGVIDACGETPEGLWLFDYKTDYISEGEEGLLLDRYKTQMLYYKTALEQILRKKVIHSYIFSFSLEKYLEISW